MPESKAYLQICREFDSKVMSSIHGPIPVIEPDFDNHPEDYCLECGFEICACELLREQIAIDS